MRVPSLCQHALCPVPVLVELPLLPDTIQANKVCVNWCEILPNHVPVVTDVPYLCEHALCPVPVCWNFPSIYLQTNKVCVIPNHVPAVTYVPCLCKYALCSVPNLLELLLNPDTSK
jgi:hypothetical protein